MKAAKEPEEPRNEAEPPETDTPRHASKSSEKAEKAEKVEAEKAQKAQKAEKAEAEKAEKAEKAEAEKAEKAEKAEAENAEKAGEDVPSQFHDLMATVRRLEAFAVEEAKRVSDKVLPQAESKVRQNIWVSLLIALGLGLILGLWLNGRRRG